MALNQSSMIRDISGSITFTVAAVAIDVAVILLYRLLYFGSQSQAEISSSLLLMGIELSFGSAITLIIVERVLAAEEKKKKSKLAFYAFGHLCSSLARLVGFSYMRIVKGDDITKEIPSLFYSYEQDNSTSADQHLANLFFFGGRVGAIDDMHFIVHEIEEFSPVHFIGDIQNPNIETLDELKKRLNNFKKDTEIIRRELSDSIYRALQVSDGEDVMLFYSLDGLREQLERCLSKSHDTAAKTVMITCEIAMMLRDVEPIYAAIERKNKDSIYHTVNIQDIKKEIVKSVSFGNGSGNTSILPKK